MIICLCQNVTEKQVKELNLPVEEVMMKTGAAMCCGCCFEMLCEMCQEQSPNMLIGNRKQT